MTQICYLDMSPAFRPELTDTLRVSILAGAPLSEAQALMLIEKMPANRFVAAYGLSEIAPVTHTLYNDTIEHIAQTVGQPIESIDIKIQNPAAHEDCPAGVTGEILVQGNALMCSYYKLPPEQHEILG